MMIWNDSLQMQYENKIVDDRFLYKAKRVMRRVCTVPGLDAHREPDHRPRPVQTSAKSHDHTCKSEKA